MKTMWKLDRHRRCWMSAAACIIDRTPSAPE
jgi:hypothetical protein